MKVTGRGDGDYRRASVASSASLLPSDSVHFRGSVSAQQAEKRYSATSLLSFTHSGNMYPSSEEDEWAAGPNPFAVTRRISQPTFAATLLPRDSLSCRESPENSRRSSHRTSHAIIEERDE